MKIFSDEQKNIVYELGIEVDIKLFQLDALSQNLMLNYTSTGEKHYLDSSIFLTHSVTLINEHWKWQKGELANEGEDYIYAYANALKQMIMDSEFLIQNYANLLDIHPEKQS